MTYETSSPSSHNFKTVRVRRIEKFRNVAERNLAKLFRIVGWCMDDAWMMLSLVKIV